MLKSKEILEQRKALTEDFHARKENLTDEEIKSFKTKIADLDKEERKLKDLEEIAKNLSTGNKGDTKEVKKASKEFRSFGEFVNYAYEKRGQNDLTTDAKGAILVPEKQAKEIFAFEPSQFDLPAMTQKVEADAAHPQQKIVLPLLEQDGNTYGGVSIEEYDDSGAIINASTLTFGSVVLEPSMKAARVIVSNTLLRNSRYSNVVERQIRNAINGFLEGKIVNGYKAAPATLTVDRVANDTLSYADIIKMYTKFRGTKGVWVIGQGHMEQLLGMIDPSGKLIFSASQNANLKVPGTLLGMPVIKSPFESTISLVDLEYMYHSTVDNIGIEFSTDERFSNNQTVIRAVFYSDTEPALLNPITLENEVDLVSPFVTLSATVPEEPVEE